MLSFRVECQITKKRHLDETCHLEETSRLKENDKSCRLKDKSCRLKDMSSERERRERGCLKDKSSEREARFRRNELQTCFFSDDMSFRRPPSRFRRHELATSDSPKRLWATCVPNQALSRGTNLNWKIWSNLNLLFVRPRNFVFAFWWILEGGRGHILCGNYV